MHLLSRVIFGSLLLLIILAPIPYGLVEPWWEAVFECAVFLLTALWCIEWLLTGRSLDRRDLWLLVPLLALVLFTLMQTLPLWPQTTPVGALRQAISFDPYETRLVGRKLLALTLALALLLRYTDSLRRLHALAFSVIGIGLASAIFGLVRQVAQHGTDGFLLAYLRPGTGYGQFVNKNHFAFLAEMALGLLAGLVVGRGVARQRIPIYVAAAVPLWTALVLSNSRGGIFAMLCQVLFLALTYQAKPSVNADQQVTSERPPHASRLVATARRLALAGALLLSLIIGMVWVAGDPLAERLGAVRAELGAEATDTSQAGRAAIWRATWRLARAHPVTGVGFGGYWIAITQYHEGSGELVPQQAHNDYLELFAGGGLFGLSLAGWFVYKLTGRARLSLADPSTVRRAIALGALTGLFGVAVHSLVDFGLHLTGNAIVCVALVALATRQLTAAPTQPKNYL
ncbi:MAG: O-antigen ligase family protein [Pyrinomonadaceae bacterium]